MPVRVASFSPRNPWSRIRESLQRGARGDLVAARELLDTVRFNSEVGPEIFAGFSDTLELTRLRLKKGVDLGRPTRASSTPLHPSFGRLDADVSESIPGIPFGLVLPRPLLPHEEASIIQQEANARPLPRSVSHIYHFAASRAQSDAFWASVTRSMLPGPLTVTLAGDATVPADVPDHVQLEFAPSPTVEYLQTEFANQSSGAVFLMIGECMLDASAIVRASRLLNVSDRVVIPFFQDMSEGPLGLFGQTRSPANGPDLNAEISFAASCSAIKKAGGLDPRFRSLPSALAELAFRLHQKGGCFIPVALPTLRPGALAENGLVTSLAPSTTRNARDDHLTPKVSIYIPAYNASQYLPRAIDSVLEQDYPDLEVCVADDGSTDGTSRLLKRRYGSNPRVRCIRLENGGIGYASNKAIELTRGLYVGQLDSDDMLKPGAVRKLVGYLDKHPDVICCYSSCERVDPQGEYLQPEYEYPQFSRQKMMLTSIVHHFRMFRRSAWERTEGFREDIRNAVDYDMFLKLAEVGPFHHIPEVLYQRRWHGGNTSAVGEATQSFNSCVVRSTALGRLGLDQFWEVAIPNPKRPRKVRYIRIKDKTSVVFWPDYSKSNHYQRLLYGQGRRTTEYLSGDLAAAHRVLDEGGAPSDLVFHLHWTNRVVRGHENRESLAASIDGFLTSLWKLKQRGARVVWSIHNAESHDSEFPDLEAEFSSELVRASDVVHLHSYLSIPEVERSFELDRTKVRVARHGSYRGVYPDYVSREVARDHLAVNSEDDVIVFAGQMRRYKGLDTLVEAFQMLLRERPRALLVLAGKPEEGLMEDLLGKLDEHVRSRIMAIPRFVSDGALQILFRAADLAVLPYGKILTSGSTMLALTFGVPTVTTNVGMTREVLGESEAGRLFEPATGPQGLCSAMSDMLQGKTTGQLELARIAAARIGREHTWQDFQKAVLS